MDQCGLALPSVLCTDRGNYGLGGTRTCWYAYNYHVYECGKFESACSSIEVRQATKQQSGSAFAILTMALQAGVKPARIIMCYQRCRPHEHLRVFKTAVVFP